MGFIILVVNSLCIKQATYFLHSSNAQVLYEPKDFADPFMTNMKFSNLILNNNNQYRSPSMETKQFYYPSNNQKQYEVDLDSLQKNYQKLTKAMKTYQQKQLKVNNNNHPFTLKQPEIIEGYSGFTYDTYRKVAPQEDTLSK